MRFAVFASGRGSNFQALLNAKDQGRLPEAEFVLLFSDKATAAALERAQTAGIATCHLNPKDYADRAAYETEVLECLKKHEIEAICLAGYMRLVGKTLLEAYPHRILNIHPALLPAFPGMHGQLDALEYGVKVSGCTVHFVDEGVDTGPIILQKTVPVLDDDTVVSLSKRILEQEHLAYAEAVRSESAIQLQDLPPVILESLRGEQVPGARPSIDRSHTTQSEQDRLLQALRRHRWRRNAAAAELGISRSTLWRKMREFGL
ncbi:MAG: phosphoribosylglycinamide formyltransferase [Planctomycetota bacterium]